MRVDKTRKINAHVLMRAMGLSDNDVADKLRHPEFYQKSIDSANDEGINSEDQALLELYKKLRPGDRPQFLVVNSSCTVDSLIPKDMI